MPKLTEAQFRQQIIDLAHYCGFSLIYMTWKSLHSPQGFPDLVLCRKEPPKLIFAELKSGPSKKATLAQEEWLEALRACPRVTQRLNMPWCYFCQDDECEQWDVEDEAGMPYHHIQSCRMVRLNNKELNLKLRGLDPQINPEGGKGDA